MFIRTYILLITVCPIRFSRQGLSSDTSVTTLQFTSDDDGNLGIQAVISGTSRRLVQSTRESNISPSGGCSIDHLEILHGSHWEELDSTGFELSQQGSETHLSVSNLKLCLLLRLMAVYSKTICTAYVCPYVCDLYS